MTSLLPLSRRALSKPMENISSAMRWYPVAVEADTVADVVLRCQRTIDITEEGPGVDDMRHWYRTAPWPSY